MEVLTAAGAVEADARVGASHAFVAHVPKKCSLRILTNRVAELQPEPEVRNFDRDRVEAIDREAAKEQESARIEELGPLDRSHSDPRQREVLDAEMLDRAARGQRAVGRFDDLVAFLVGELDRPLASIREVAGQPDRR
jgi:hypothetical protein